ncbi:hypothetical protein CFE70_009616 [Pyrenophora teres f. teres 0-1]
MPPALSDHESSDVESVPAKGRGKAKQPQVEPEPEPVDDEDEDDSEVGEDEYGASSCASESHCADYGIDLSSRQSMVIGFRREGAIDVMNEYFAKIGGRPEPKGQKRKGRPSVSGPKSNAGTPTASVKRAKQDKLAKAQPLWSPPPGSWEHDVSHIDTVEEKADPKTGELGRFAYIVWLNHQKTQHPLKHVYQKCPQKMLEYYESHLVFTNNADGTLNGDEGDDVIMKGY